MEKRAIIAAVLSVAVFYGYYLLFPAPQKQAAIKPARQAVTAQMTTAQAPATAKPLQAPFIAPAEARDVTVETDLYSAVFSNQGGAVKSFVLKKYRETNRAGGKLVALLQQNNPAEFMLTTGFNGFSLSPATLYSTKAENLVLKGKEKGQIEFSYASPQGYAIKKIYTFSGDNYAMLLRTEVSNSGAQKIAGSLQLTMPYQVEDKTKQTRFEVSNSVTLSDDQLKTGTLKDLQDKPKDYAGNVLWTGFADKYFLSAVINKDNSIGSVRIVKTANNFINTTISTPEFALQPGQSYAATNMLFFGPKDLDVLKAEDNKLDRSLDLGWFSAIAKPLLLILKFFNKFTHNYGVSIIIITVILKILFFPLTHKSYKSMKEMQKLQPKMVELKEKYKDDREGLNRATMELYKTHKVNPMGGCLPMVVQIPVFFALYKALMFSIELRHAPFMLWITDLSAKDPYYVTPIVMGITMFIQQKMTPTTMDPAQAKIMLVLPIVFTFMFVNFPSGLVIYWLVNNILTIAQQAYINRLLKE